MTTMTKGILMRTEIKSRVVASLVAGVLIALVATLVVVPLLYTCWLLWHGYWFWGTALGATETALIASVFAYHNMSE